MNLAEVERQQAHIFLAKLGLYLSDNHIFRIAGPPALPLKPYEVQAVQLLWDAEWENIKPQLVAQIETEKEARARAQGEGERWRERERERELLSREYEAKRLRADRVMRDNAVRADAAAEERRQHRNRPRYGPDYPEAVHGFTEHHLYGPRGFKSPFKYEETPNEIWATQTLFPGGRIGGRLSYRPSHPLADNKALSIVTADICGDPPKGRSALEARAPHG